MTDDQLELRLRDWYRAEVPTEETAPAALRASLTAIPSGSATSGRRFRSRPAVALLAAAALLTAAIVGGAVLVGSGIVKMPSVTPLIVPPTAPASSEPSAELRSDAPTSTPASRGLIAYVTFVPLEAVGGDCARGAGVGSTPAGCSRIWVSRADGTGARELLPDHPGYQTPIQWSADGTRLLIEDAAGLWLVDATGTIVQSLPLEGLCPGDCTVIWSYSLSPDGATIAFARPPITTSGNSVIALADVATGHVTELASTASLASIDSFGRDTPRWSPDGTRLLFTQEEDGGQPGAGLSLVDADGTDLRQFVPKELDAIFPRWSPDGSLIAFESVDAERQGDIYVVRPDGTGLRQVTSGGFTVWPEWTADGRLVTTHLFLEPELWIMDADGANTSMLPVDDVTRLTAANCLICAWDPNGDIPEPEFGDSALWQPQP